MDRAGNAANRPRTTVKPRDFGAICNAVRADRCWLTPMRELRSGVRLLGEAANGDRGANGDRATCVNGGATSEPTGRAFFLDRLQDSVAYGCVPERICYCPAGISPGERAGAIQPCRTTLGCNENDIDLMIQRRS
jgi:hypothetical protein